MLCRSRLIGHYSWVPQSRGNEWELSVELPDGETKMYTLGDLKSRFKHHSITGKETLLSNKHV